MKQTPAPLDFEIMRSLGGPFSVISSQLTPRVRKTREDQLVLVLLLQTGWKLPGF